jgi:hypothetical protein
MTKKPLTELQAQIIRIMTEHRGQEHRISRVELCRQLSKSMGRPVRDREMRIAIEVLRIEHPSGAYICSTTQGGYWYAESIDELEGYIAQDEHRAKRILARLRQQKLRARALVNRPLPGTEVA